MTISRRRLLSVLGGSAVALPLTSLLRSARAQPSMGPVRFLGVRTPHGADRDWWIPKTPAGLEPPEVDMALSDLTFDYDMGVLEPLMNWRNQITVIDGLDTQITKEGTRGDRRTAHGHNEQGTLLTGAQPPSDRSGNFDNHPSIDFWMHGQLGAPALLTASVEGSSSWKCMSYDGSGIPRTPEVNPGTVFRQAFPEGFMPPDPGEIPVDTTAGEQRIASFLEGELTALRNQLSGTEREKLVAHLAAMTSIAPGTGPGSNPMGACSVTGADGPNRNGRIQNVGDVNTVTRLHSQVIGQAFACGRARCATLQILNDFPNWYSDLPEVRTDAILARYGNTFRFHEDLVHDYWSSSGTDQANLRVGYLAGLRWATTHFAAVLEELDAIIDPLDPSGGSVLDNTIVFWHNEFGHDGHDRQETRHPAVIAGGGSRVLRLGRYLRLRNINSSERIPHNKLLTSIAHAMGFADVNYFGDRDLSNDSRYMGPLEPLMV